MVHSISLLPLGAAIVGASLAWFTLLRPRPLSRKQRFFVGLNLSTALWSFSSFALINHAPGQEAGTFPYGAPGYVISTALTLGVVASTYFWFLFAAEHARKRAWTRSPVTWIAALPGIYTMLATATNPSHTLLVRQSEPFARVDIGLLAYPYLVGTYALVALGTYLLIRGSWTRGTTAGRRQAIFLGIAALLPTMGGLLWQLLRQFTPLDPTLNPIPVLFAVLELVLVGEVVTGGLADLLPHARAAAFDAMHDAAIVLDSRLRVITVNRAAARLFPMIEEGMPIDEYFSTLGQHARTFLERHPEGVNFEADLGGFVYWGRVRQTGGNHAGCLVLLTDLTDLRSAQAKLTQLGVEPWPARLEHVAVRERESVEA
jgi:PAS domain-containing protein